MHYRSSNRYHSECVTRISAISLTWRMIRIWAESLKIHRKKEYVFPLKTPLSSLLVQPNLVLMIDTTNLVWMPFNFHDSVWPCPIAQSLLCNLHWEGRRERNLKSKTCYRLHLPLRQHLSLRQPSGKCTSHSCITSSYSKVQCLCLIRFGCGRNFLKGSVIYYWAIIHLK